MTNVVDSHQAPLSLDVEFAIRVTAAIPRRCTFTISQKIPGTPPTVALLSECQVINEALNQLKGQLREEAKEAKDRELGKRLQELADEY